MVNKESRCMDVGFQENSLKERASYLNTEGLERERGRLLVTSFE